MSGYIVYLLGVPIAWRSKAQPHCSLSSSESEYVAISELVRERQIANQVLRDMGITLELPIRIYNDNIGAIQLVRNNMGGLESGM